MAFGPNRSNEISDSYTRSNVYSTGTVNSVSASGGFAGFVANMSASNIYYDFTNAPIDPIGLFLAASATYDIKAWTSTQMKSQTLADGLNAGRSTAVWYFDASKNDGYPTLDFEQLLATSDNAVRSDIKVYPTVVTDFITINSKEKNLTYKVVDFSGRLIKSGSVTTDKVNLSQLGKGNYMLHLQNGGKMSSFKFIKK